MVPPYALTQGQLLETLSNEQLLQISDVLNMMLHPHQTSRMSLAELDVDAALSSFNI